MEQFVIPYIMYESTKEAVAYYKSIFGGHVRYQMLGKDAPNCPEGQEENIMHLEYVLNENVLYMADTYVPDEGRIHLHLNYSDHDELRKAFNAMAIESTVIQPLKVEFWGATYGVLKDKFGVTWQFHGRVKQ